MPFSWFSGESQAFTRVFVFLCECYQCPGRFFSGEKCFRVDAPVFHGDIHYFLAGQISGCRRDICIEWKIFPALCVAVRTACLRCLAESRMRICELAAGCGTWPGSGRRRRMHRCGLRVLPGICEGPIPDGPTGGRERGLHRSVCDKLTHLPAVCGTGPGREPRDIETVRRHEPGPPGDIRAGSFECGRYGAVQSSGSRPDRAGRRPWMCRG